MTKKQVGVFALSMLSVSVFAQSDLKNDSTLSRTVVVEQEYNPNILDASKINVLPRVEEPTVSKKKIEYSTVAMPVTSFGFYNEMRPFNNPEKQAESKYGYIRLGYGNYGNLDARLSYLFRLSQKDRLGILAGMEGMKGKYTIIDTRDKLYYYHSHAKFDYLHQFDRIDMNIAGSWGLSNFNYNFLSPVSHQRFASGDIHFSIKSTDEMLPVKFDVETNLLLYSRVHNWIGEGFPTDKANESKVYTKANVNGNISDEQLIGIQLKMDNLFYTKDYQDNYTSLQLNPYYGFNNEDWKLHVGANVDFSFGMGKTVQVSPDVKIQYVFSDSYALYAEATGGRLLNDFRRLEQFCPYAEVLKGQKTANTYEQVNAFIGFKASPYPGVWFNLYGGYQNLKDELYQTMNEDVPVLTLSQENGNNIYGGAGITYTFKDYLKLSAEGIYRHWDMSDKALIFKPALQLDINMDIHPFKAFALNIGYKYIQREKTRNQQMNSRIDAVNNLYAGASYDIYKGLTVYVKVDNLLNKKYSYFMDYPAEKLNFIAGISYRF